MVKDRLIIISLGGSLIVSQKAIDTVFLRQFRDFILGQIKKGRRFLIVTGGGKTSRDYRDAGKKIISRLTHDDIDWIGIQATRLNAQLLRTIFGQDAYPEVVIDPLKKIETTKPVVVAAGWKPGWSTDYVATLLAKLYGVKTVINLTNVQAVFDRNPQKDSGAKPLTKISWAHFLSLIGHTWEPGMRVPFDPVASKLAQKEAIKVIIFDGHNLLNLENFLAGEPFIGTEIE